MEDLVGRRASLSENFSDDENEDSASSQEELERVPPGRFGRESEASDWTKSELVERKTILSRLKKETRKLYEEDDLAFLRLVRGYWNYDRRTKTVTSVAETVAEMRKRYDCEDVLRRRLSFDFHHDVWPSWILGQDVYGHPVVLERFSALDWHRAMKFSVHDLVRLRIQALQALQAECARISRHRSSRVYKTLFVVDVGGASTWTLMSSKVVEFAKIYAKVLEQMFADAVWMNVIVNAPAVARALWHILEKVVDEETREVVRFLPVSNSSCKAALIQAGVPENVIPPYLGGTKPLRRKIADVVDRELEGGAGAAAANGRRRQRRRRDRNNEKEHNDKGNDQHYQQSAGGDNDNPDSNTKPHPPSPPMTTTSRSASSDSVEIEQVRAQHHQQRRQSLLAYNPNLWQRLVAAVLLFFLLRHIFLLL